MARMSPSPSEEPGVDCAFAPDLSRAPEGLRARLAYDPRARRLVLHGGATPEEIQALRDSHPTELAWQLAIDRLAAKARVPGATGSGSRFPMTPWGLVLGQLETQDDAHWRRFMELYRRPIGKSIVKALEWTGRRETASAAELADEFFSWFFEKKIHTRLRRVDAAGRVNRFRGYLRRCVATFLKEQRRLPIAVDLDGLADPDRDDAVSRATDEELCRDALEDALAHFRATDAPLWRAMVHDFQKLTLEETAARTGVSVATAHRLRKKARDAFRAHLIDQRLRSAVVDEREALEEWQELIPVLSRVIEEVASTLGGDAE